MNETATKTYVSGEWEWDADREAYTTAYAVEVAQTGYNGFIRPVVTREVLEAIVTQQTSVNTQFIESERMHWDGDAVVVVWDDSDVEDVRLVPDERGNYDLSPLGWTFEALDANDVVINRVG